MAGRFQAKVRSVLSGDTVVLINNANPPAERIIALAYVASPRLSKDGDEPFAFQAREYLRNLAVGKVVQFSVAYTVQTSKREYGTVLLSETSDLTEEMVKAGWVKVREEAGRREESEEIQQRLEKLRALEAKAKSEGLGLWSGADGTIEVQQDLGGPDFLKQWKGKTVDGIVERVFNGDRVLVRLLLSEKKHIQVMTLLAGIRTPATERTVQSTGQKQPGEEFGEEARRFVEARILQRKLKVKIVGASAQGQLVASLIHPAGNIAAVLLSEGLARCNDFHSTMLGTDMAPLRAAEKSAQEKKIKLHKHHVGKATEASKQDMVVTKIIGADTIIVRTRDGAEKRVNISSVRGPRTGESAEAPFRDEAKEFLRKRLIGKHVQISVDGSRPAADGFEAREVATVTEKGKNIGLALVQEGWATVIRHRKDDTDRAPNYDELLAAQETAKEEQKGIWSGKPSKAKQYVDVSETAQKAKVQLTTLQRQRKVPGIVDFVKAGSRFTILIPKEGIKLTLVLGGVRAPRAPGRTAQEKGEPFGQEALELANRRCNQRDCEIDIFDIDKVGGFIGSLYVNHENFAKVLAEEGLASVHHYSAEKYGNLQELDAAEKKAKEGKKGLWHDYDPSQDEEAQEATPADSTNESAATIDKKPTDYRDVVVTNMDGNGKLKIQEVGKGTAALEVLMREFKSFHINPSNAKSMKDAPKAGDFVAAKFDLDGEWYRARIRSNDRANKQAEVVYIDYGNTAKIPWSELRPLDQPQFSTQKLKAQAVDASLSFVQMPTAEHYLADAIDFIAGLTADRKLVASFDFVDSKENLSYITLYDTKSGGGLPAVTDSINRDVVANGQGLVPRKLKPWERSKPFEGVLKSLREAESKAKQDRLGMWEYGDITED